MVEQRSSARRFAARRTMASASSRSTTCRYSRRTLYRSQAATDLSPPERRTPRRRRRPAHLKRLDTESMTRETVGSVQGPRRRSSPATLLMRLIPSLIALAALLAASPLTAQVVVGGDFDICDFCAN